eukprot:COSAG06_NODE_3251_length_5615_cov_5.697426_3_plen_236_part_00
MHAPGRSHPQAQCSDCRRPPARCCSARPAAPACFDLWYRPGPAVRCCSNPSPTPALSHSKRTHTHRTAPSAVQVQCEQCKSSAASGRYQPRARSAEDHNGAVQAVFPSPRQTLPHTQHSTPRAKRRTPPAKPVRTHRGNTRACLWGQATDTKSRIARTRPLPSTSTVWPPPAATCTILVGEVSCSGVVRSVVSPRPSCPQFKPVAHACTLTQRASATHRTAPSESAVRAMQVKCS